MIEVMACGAPVVAWRRGWVPEVIFDGTTGFTVRSIEKAMEAVDHIQELDHLTIRRVFDRRFTVDRMADTTCRSIAGLPGSPPTRLSRLPTTLG
jgi:glycosyltransferase involved in cell wall biosynthesis